jgi:hypothetical protein
MQSKKLKYQAYLEKFPNCPPDYFVPVNRDGFRWVHKDVNENDFVPLNIKKEPTQRILDNSDSMCMGYGLSLFETLQQAMHRYLYLFKKKRALMKSIFIEDVGDHVAHLSINEQDGIADEPNDIGHFTFHEFAEVGLQKNVLSLHPIFENDASN